MTGDITDDCLTQDQAAELRMLQAYVSSGRIGEYVNANVYRLMNIIGQDGPEQMNQVLATVQDSVRSRLKHYGIDCPELDGNSV